MELNLKQKSSWFFLLAILVVAIVAGIVVSHLVKYKSVDPLTGEDVQGGAVLKGSVTLPRIGKPLKVA